MGENENSPVQSGSGQQFEERQFVVFSLARERYAVNINSVKEIMIMQELTTVPKSAPYVKGVINLRGSVVPIFDLAGKLGLDARQETASSRIIVVETGKITAGLIVDGVSEVAAISAREVEEPSKLVASDVEEQYIEGIAKLEHLVIILDMDKMLSGVEMDLAV